MTEEVFANNHMVTVIGEYKHFGEEYTIALVSNTKIKDIPTEKFINVIKQLERQVSDGSEVHNIIQIYNLGWIWIYKDVLLNRRINKIIKLKSIISEKT